jgi:hypothetical protein
MVVDPAGTVVGQAGTAVAVPTSTTIVAMADSITDADRIAVLTVDTAAPVPAVVTTMAAENTGAAAVTKAVAATAAESTAVKFLSACCIAT